MLVHPKHSPKSLYFEGDRFLVKAWKKNHLEVNRSQVCEGVRAIGKNRKERIQVQDFVPLYHQAAIKKFMEYSGNTYDLKQTVVLSNGDGGSDYIKYVLDEFNGITSIYEFCLDAFHVKKRSRIA